MADPLAQYFDQATSGGSGGGDPLSSFFDGPQVASVPNVATLRARHAANTAAGQEAYKPGWIEAATTMGPNGVQDELLRGAKNAIVNTPERIGHAITGLAGMASEMVDPAAYKGVADNPIVNLPGKIGAGLVTGLTEPLMSPSTTGEAATGGLIDTAATMGAAKVAKAVASAPTAWKTYQGAQVGNRIKAGLGIANTDVRALNAVDQSLSTLRGGTKTKVPFTNTQGMADFVSGHNKKFFKTHRADIAEINRTLPVEFMGEQTTLQNVSNEITRLNKRLHNYQSQAPQTRAIMEEVNPSLKADVERLNAARDTVNGALDTVAPQSARQADIMRTFFNLKELEDMAATRAAQLKAIKEIAKGSKLPISEVAKDFMMNKLTLGMTPGAQIPSKTLAFLRKTMTGPAAADPDRLIRIAGRKFKHVKAAEPITPEPMALSKATSGVSTVTGEEAASARNSRQAALVDEGLSPDEVALRMRTEALPTEGQTFMPFVQPGVGAVGHELPQVPGAPRAIQVPNSLTQQFNRMPPEEAIAPVTGSESATAYASRRRSLIEQRPDLTPAQIDQLMRSQSIPGTGQEFLPLAPPQIGAFGRELPNQFDPLQSQIRMPNQLTQRFSGITPEETIAPVSGNEAASAYQSRQQSLFDQNPQMTPDQLTEAMRQQSLPGVGQERLPFVAPQIGGVPQRLGGLQGSQGPSFPNTYGPTSERMQNVGGMRFAPRREMSRSGRPIISLDGGVTWEYE